MSFKDIIGQNRAWTILQNTLRNGSVGHAYLFFGPEGIGKRLTAITFAKALNCLNEKGDSCDECNSCRKIEGGNHPDVIIINPEGVYIKIEQIRRLQRMVNFKVYEGRRKVVILDSINEMTDEASNSFLKTLEEPPDETILILLSTNIHTLLPTIISRCQGIRFNLLPVESIMEVLIKKKGVGIEEARLIASLSNGRLGKAISIDIETTLKDRGDAFSILSDPLAEGVCSIFSKADIWAKDGDNIHDLLDHLSNLCRDIAILKSSRNHDFIVNLDMIDELRLLSERLSFSTVQNIFQTVQNTIIFLKKNANLHLSIEVMMMRIGEEMGYL
ncbi:MAG: DNA polymerase III subunit delta' [Nitrospinae bacterium]|nr:DNA polymerase III subunit delta' [Nitrospinota bacterium]